MTVKVLVCRVGRLPVVEELQGSRGGGHGEAISKIVGGYYECITLDDGTDLWSNEDGRGLGLPLNRVIPAAPRGVPPGFEGADVIYRDEGLASPDEPGEWRIFGDFMLCNVDDAGELAPIRDEQIARYTAMFDTEDIEAAKAMNEWCVDSRRTSMR